MRHSLSTIRAVELMSLDPNSGLRQTPIRLASIERACLDFSAEATRAEYSFVKLQFPTHGIVFFDRADSLANLS